MDTPFASCYSPPMLARVLAALMVFAVGGVQAATAGTDAQARTNHAVWDAAGEPALAAGRARCEPRVIGRRCDGSWRAAGAAPPIALLSVLPGLLPAVFAGTIVWWSPPARGERRVVSPRSSRGPPGPPTV